MKHKKVTVINENFKEWLKGTDPQNRIKRLAYISRTLFTMGHQGPQIKRSFVQLSQICKVRLVQLQEKHIMQYSRPHLEKLQAASPEQHNLLIHMKRPNFKNMSQKRHKKKYLPRNIASIRELWSTLGMESPIDKTAKFLSKQFNSSEAITLHSASEVSSPGEDSDTVPQSVDEVLEIHESPETVEPFLKISETFSLSDVSDGDCQVISESDDSAEMINVENVVSQSRKEDIISKGGKEDTLSKGGENNVTAGKKETIRKNEEWRVPEHSGQENNQTSSSEETKPKVGTIRVKSLGLLVDPQLQSTSNSNILPSNNVIKSCSDVVTNPDVPRVNCELISTSKRSVEESFFNVYSFYFDDLVEDKIPKLGELLHLAIADAMRFRDRVKRADQLSSEDFIKEEKLRAEKEFTYMMRRRGVEFTPLCNLIIQHFDSRIKTSLFHILFCRILKHSSTINPANENYITAGRKVISLMFKSYQYKDKVLLRSLENEGFEKQVRSVWQLVEECVRRKAGLGIQWKRPLVEKLRWNNIAS